MGTVCVHGGTCASVRAGWKEGRGCDRRGAALGEVVNCLLSGSLQAWGLAIVTVWLGLRSAPSSPLPHHHLQHPPPRHPSKSFFVPFFPQLHPLSQELLPHKSAFWSLELGRRCWGVLGRQLTRVKSAVLQGRELCWGCRSPGHHWSLSQREAVTLY